MATQEGDQGIDNGDTGTSGTGGSKKKAIWAWAENVDWEEEIKKWTEGIDLQTQAKEVPDFINYKV